GTCNLMCRLDSGSWQFLKKEIFYRGKNIYQITAIDVTEQEIINQKLENYGNQLREKQEQLNIALMNLEKLGKEEAISCFWDYIHGVLGQRISVLQRLFAQEPPLDIEEISLLIKELQKDFVIKEENPDEIYRGLMSSFISLGVNLHREGKIPGDDKISNLFIEIIREGTTNALKHGQANNIYLVLSDGEKYTLTMTNDGVLPQEHIVWGGGLHSIYNKVKELGGNLIISTRPEFSLYAEIPR
ncbi:MAG TPA: hypothetical protein VFC70_02230, partial [Oscillospiraceae bacterium]|nr:hypothetical protein [Oscillospiraceae bacterium]